jgi:hypothetical protein
MLKDHKKLYRIEIRNLKGLLVTNLQPGVVGGEAMSSALNAPRCLVENDQTGLSGENNCRQQIPILVGCMSSRRKRKTIAMPLEMCPYQRWPETVSTATAAGPVKMDWTRRSMEWTNTLN